MATSIGKVKERLGKYVMATHPANIESLIGEQALERFLVGCSSVLFVGIATYYIRDGNVTGGFSNLSRRSSLTDMAGTIRPELFHPICQMYRQDREGNGRCIRCDKEVAMKYYTGKWEGCKLYRCHLNLIDMTYPLRLGHRLLGVLFGGQIVVRPEDTNWREALKEISDSIIWDINTDSTEIPSRVVQISDICKAIKTAVHDGPKADVPKAGRELVKFARDNVKDKKNKRYYITLEGLVTRFKLLREFGKMIEELLAEMYQAKKEAASNALLHTVSDYLAGGDVLDQGKWEEHCQRLLDVLSNNDTWHMYVKNGDEFIRWFPTEDGDMTIGAGAVMPAVESDKLVRLDNGSDKGRALCDRLGMSSGETYGYLSRHQAAQEDVSTLIVVSGALEKIDTDMIEALSRTIAQGNDRAQLTFLSRKR